MLTSVLTKNMIVNLDYFRQCSINMEDNSLYLGAEEAALALGISVTTLYAYVSRKQIRSEAVPGTKQRRYWKADIDRLRGHSSAEVSEVQNASIATKTEITLITESGLYFRGKNAIELAKTSTLESLAAMLWEVDEEDVFTSNPFEAPTGLQELHNVMLDVGRHERCLAYFPLIERANPKAYDLSRLGYARTGAEVVRWFAALAANSTEPPTIPIHQFLAQALRAPRGFDEVIRTLLVLSADHEFDPITYAVRAIANVGVTPFQAATAGMIASQGQRFHAERFGSSSRFLQEILASKDGSSAVVDRLRNGQPLSGFGFTRSRPDPRTTAMMEVMAEKLIGDQEFERLRVAERVALEVAEMPMDFILVALFVGHRLGLKGDELAVSGVGRVAGWIAHAMEQFQNHALIRPRAQYTGRLP